MSQCLYAEEYRPCYHFTASCGWLNDPNGLVFHKGEYHLFYQHNPFDVQWGNMTWGHAVSRDLLHWMHLPHAIEPYENGTIFSGTAVVDQQSDSSHRLVAFYTHAKQPFVQCAAQSLDNGRSWDLINHGSPVVPNQGLDLEERDPKVFWHCNTQQWVMLLWVSKGIVRFFTSDDMIRWEFASDAYLDGFYECPDMFEITVENTDTTYWVVYDAGLNYWVGHFDGKVFTPIQEMLKGDCGLHFWAAQTWNNTTLRLIQIAWMRDGKYPDMPFNQQMTFPCELSMVTTDDGLRLRRYPIPEISELYAEQIHFAEIHVDPTETFLHALPSKSCDIEMEVLWNTELSINIRVGGFEFSVENGCLIVGGRHIAIIQLVDRLRVRVLIDKTSVEIFLQYGLISCSECALLNDASEIQIVNNSSPVILKNLQIRKIKSIWNKTY